MEALYRLIEITSEYQYSGLGCDDGASRRASAEREVRAKADGSCLASRSGNEVSNLVGDSPSKGSFVGSR
jgi:hypothetical protein